MSLLASLGGALIAACHPGPPARADVRPGPRWTAPSPCETPPAALLPVLGRGPISAAQRDSLVRDVQARRAAWRARGITDYRIRFAMTCFCPWSPPAVLEVRDGLPVALFDTTGRPAGRPPSEPWAYTIEALFDLIERAAQNDEVLDVSYDPCLGHPTSARVDPKGLDNWYAITADHLTLPR